MGIFSPVELAGAELVLREESGMGLRRVYQGVPGSAFITNTNTRKGQPQGNTTVVQQGKQGVFTHPPPNPRRPAAPPPCPTAQTLALPRGRGFDEQGRKHTQYVGAFQKQVENSM